MVPLGVRVDSLGLSLMEKRPVLGLELAALVAGAGAGAVVGARALSDL